MAVLFRRGKSRQQVLGYLKKRYFPDNSLQEIESMLDYSKRGPNSRILSKLESNPEQTFNKLQERRLKIGVASKEVFTRKSFGDKLLWKQRLSESQRKRLANEPPEKKLAWRQKLSAAHNRRFKSASERQKSSDSQRNRFKHEPPEKKLARKQNMSTAMKLYWAKVKSSIKIILEEQGLILEKQTSRKKPIIFLTQEASALNEIITGQSIKILGDAIKKLPRLQQQILRMHYYKNLPIEEIAEKIKTPPEEAQRQLNDAIKTLSQNKKIQELK
jgi:RNA polymerase sigma factor (sigma-70 family)